MRRATATRLSTGTLALVSLLTGRAAAQEPQVPPAPVEAPPARPEAAPPPPARAGAEERPLPDYDGRAGPGTGVGEVLLWFPRVVFFPVHLAAEFVLRRPLGLLTVAAERGQWVKELTDFFTFGPEGNIGVVPTALIDFGLRSSVGVYFFYDDFLARGNHLRVHAATGGVDWLRLTVADRVELDENATLRFRGEAWRRPDGIFHGIGPDTPQEPEFRYATDVLGGSVLFNANLGERVTLEVGTAVRSVTFTEGGCCGEPPLRFSVDAGYIERPPGFDDGYTAYRQSISLAYDTRKPRPAPGHGLRVETRVEHNLDLEEPGKTRWIEYGGSVGGYVDVTGKNRVLGLSVSTLFADPLGDEEIPFPELVSLGGDGPMRGYRAARLLGRSAAVAQLEYRWPVWSFLDGSVTGALGNVFGEHLEDFDPEKLRVAVWGGVRSSASRDTSFDVLVGFGTDTFEQGTRPNEVRFLFGTHQGF